MVSSSATKTRATPQQQQQHDDDVALLTRFFGLVFALSSPLYFLTILAGFDIVGPPELAMLYITLVTGIPCLAASILVTSDDNNKNNRSSLYSKSFCLHQDKLGWYVLAILIGPMINIVSNALVFAFSPDDIPTEVAVDISPLLLPVAAVAFLVMAAGEEIGWMTYAFEPLKRRCNHNALQAAWRLGVIWALWHLPFFFFLFPPPLAITIPCQVLTLIANRITCVWLYENSNHGTLAVILYHAADNAALLVFPDLKATVPMVPCATSIATALLIVLVFDSATLTKCRLLGEQRTTATERAKEE